VEIEPTNGTPEEVAAMTAILVILTIVFFVALDAYKLWRERQLKETMLTRATVRPFAPLSLPRGLFLDRSHTWARLQEAGELRIGVDELLAQTLGGADRIELPAAGTALRRGQTLATIWRDGRKLTVPSPIDGTVVATNAMAAADQLAADPYGAAWLVSLWPLDPREAIRPMHLGEPARRFLERELRRLVEFLSLQGSAQLGPALADGAHPVVGAALALDHQSWKAFQEHFASIRN
jgi:glycine cleavage system H protein